VFAEPEPAQGHRLGRLTMRETDFYSIVIAIAIHTLWLVARAQDVGLIWVSIPDPQTVNPILEASTEWRFIGYLCLVYPERARDTCPLLPVLWHHPSLNPRP